MESIPSTQTMIPGFRFRPYDNELITDYLLKKIKGEALPWEGIVECDIYGERSPWEICSDLSDPEEKVYFFTRLKKLSKNRVGRTAGCGVWHENSSVKIYDYKGDIIGARKLFSFMVKQGSCKKKSNWIMHEFSLIGEQEQNTNWVLCNIQNKGSELRVGIKRRFQDHQSCIGQVTPITIVPFETETPQPLTNPPLDTCIDFSNVFYVDVDDFMSSLPIDEDSDNCLRPLPFPLPVGTCVHFSDLF
jgi:hypothetical protein